MKMTVELAGRAHRPRPRLAYVSPLPPARTGIAGYSAALLPALSAFYRIDLVAERGEEGYCQQTGGYLVRDADWLRQHAADYDRVLYQFGNSAFHAWMVPLLRDVPGVVVLHDFFLGGLFDALDQAADRRGRKAEALFASHGYPALLRWQSEPDAVNERYPCNRPVLEHARGVLVHSAESCRLARCWLGEYGDRGWQQVPLARALPARITGYEARKALGLAQEAFLVCSFGLLAPTKLNHRLLNAWLASDLALDPSARLLFVGAPADEDYVQRMLACASSPAQRARITITGWVEDDTYALYLAAADVAVQLRTSSRGESSAAVLDCMGYGLPTIVNAHASMAELPVGAVWQLPDHFEDGQLVAALEGLRACAPARSELGEYARAYVVREHAPEHCARAYYHALQAIYSRGNKQVKTHPAGAALSDDAVAMAPRQLLVDISATCETERITGIERVARALLRVWLADDGWGARVEPVYLKRSGECWHYHYARRFGAALMDIEPALADGPVRFARGDCLLALDICAGALVEAHTQGLYRQLREMGVSCQVMIHDVLPATRPELFPASIRPYFLAWLDAVLRWNAAICVTDAAAAQLRQWLGENRPECVGLPIHRSWHGADFAPGAAQDSTWSGPALGVGPALLMVGTLEPRKGHLQALQACSLLWRNGLPFNLVLVGREGWQGVEAAERRPVVELLRALHGHAEWQRRLFWLGSVNDEQLAGLYARADGLLAASWDEGFGLPLAEAARYGLPVLARDIPVFREVTGGHGRFFQADTPESLAEALRQWLVDGMTPCAGATRWPSWQQSAARLMALALPSPGGKPCAGLGMRIIV